jgi:hypothetical protein
MLRRLVGDSFISLPAMQARSSRFIGLAVPVPLTMSSCILYEVVCEPPRLFPQAFVWPRCAGARGDGSLG